MPKALSSAERVFVFEYLLNRNGAEAAVAAGFPATAGRRLLGKRVVREELAREEARRAERYAVSPERIMLEWSRIAFADARDFHPPVGQTLDLDRLPSDQSAAISEFTLDEQIDDRTGQVYRRTKVKLHDKVAALRDLARASGMLNEAPVMSIEMRYSQMTREERLQLARELLEHGEKYLVVGGEIVDSEGADEGEGEGDEAPRDHRATKPGQ